MPMTFGIAMPSSRKTAPRYSLGLGGKWGGVERPPIGLIVRAHGEPSAVLQVLARIDDSLDAPELLFGLAHERLHVDDPLTLLAGDLGPVVGVGGVGKVFVLLELFTDGRQKIVGHDALLAATDVALERQLLGAAHDRLDHG